MDYWASPLAQQWRVLLQCRDSGSVPELGKSLEEGMAAHARVLACRIPWTEEPGGLQSMVLQSQTGPQWLSMRKCMGCYCPHTVRVLRPISPLDVDVGPLRVGSVMKVEPSWMGSLSLWPQRASSPSTPVRMPLFMTQQVGSHQTQNLLELGP